MRLVGRRRHEQLAVHELVPRRLQRAVGDELPNLSGGPTALRCGHGHNVLGLAMREQEVIRQYAADEASVRHHFIAALIYVGRSGRRALADDERRWSSRGAENRQHSRRSIGWTTRSATAPSCCTSL